MEKITLKPIGIIYTPFDSLEGMPIQPTGAIGVNGIIELFPEFTEGLKDLGEFSHIILIYHFHLSGDHKLLVKPFMDDDLHGVFSTRAPKRPNPIGISVVKLIKIDMNKLYIENVDMLNKSPLLDIKPYISDVDYVEVDKMGWLKGKSHKMGDKKSDNRFCD
ncbi:MAG: tRNA (N6-threonylcarbamoyladenosine(37)-N6)-methyltransferase TrmO [Bacteroidales bacterium]